MAPSRWGRAGHEAWDLRQARKQLVQRMRGIPLSCVVDLVQQPLNGLISCCAQLKEGELACWLEVSIRLVSRLSSPQCPDRVQ